jgi:hypothetical protein
MDAEALQEFHDRCLAARQRFLELAVRATPRAKIQELAEKLGLAVADEFTQVGEAELAFAYDLAVFTAPPGRSRAIDRVAKQHASLQTEAALVLNGMVRSWFSVFRVLAPHPDAGMVVEDGLLGGEAWLLDAGIAEEAVPGAVLATRLARVGGFAITCGVHAVLDDGTLAMLRQAQARLPDPAMITEDIRFPTALWQRALQT